MIEDDKKTPVTLSDAWHIRLEFTDLTGIEPYEKFTKVELFHRIMHEIDPAWPWCHKERGCTTDLLKHYQCSVCNGRVWYKPLLLMADLPLVKLVGNQCGLKVKIAHITKYMVCANKANGKKILRNLNSNE